MRLEGNFNVKGPCEKSVCLKTFSDTVKESSFSRTYFSIVFIFLETNLWSRFFPFSQRVLNDL